MVSILETKWGEGGGGGGGGGGGRGRKKVGINMLQRFEGFLQN